MFLKIIFTWWNKQTFGTFLKNIFFGKFVGSDQYGNKYYKSKNDERWVVYSTNIEATKITSDWYLWIHHTIDKIPDNNKQSLMAKKHLENQTGTINSHKPVKISKKILKKIMKLGNKIILILFLGMISIKLSFAEQKITTSPLINIDDIKPSFEEVEEKNENLN